MIAIEATAMTAEIITHTTLRELVAAGAVREAAAVAHGARWALVVRYGGIERVLAARKTKKPRSWAHLDSLARYLAEIGIRQFTTDARDYDPDQPGQNARTGPRPCARRTKRTRRPSITAWRTRHPDRKHAVAYEKLGFTLECPNDPEQCEGCCDIRSCAPPMLLLAKEGDARAQYNLGLMYYNGRGVPQEYEEAPKWFLSPVHGARG